MGLFRKPPARKLSDAELAAIYAPPKAESVEEGEARALSEEEQDRFERLLVAHDIDDALLAALAYAMRITGQNAPRAKELQRRAYSLLWERRTWDPSKEKLSVYLCGLVRSENSHDAEKQATRERYEEAFVTEAMTLEGRHARSPEDLAIELEQADENRRAALGKLEPLRVAFVKARDKVNLVWLKLSLEGLETPAEMAAESGIDVREFYRAADRRKRHVQRLLDAMRAGRKDDEVEENG